MMELLAAVDANTTAAAADAAANAAGSKLHIGLAALGSALGVGLVGMKAAEATGRNPGAAGRPPLPKVWQTTALRGSPPPAPLWMPQRRPRKYPSTT